MSNKVFFHIDVNSAFLSWEAARRIKENSDSIDLRNIASAVSGDPKKRSGIILAKSSIAKKFGVKTGEPVHLAKRKCPELYLVPADFNLYIESSNAMIRFLNKYSPHVYQYSIDEAFIDMTGTQRLFGDPITCANSMREKIKEELGFTINIGISDNMVLAKMAGDFSKPDKTHTLFKNEIEEKMWPIPIEELFFVGRKTAGELRKMGIETIGDLAKMDINYIKRKLKKHGEVIHNHANGLDGYNFLGEKAKNKSVGNSTTTAFDISDLGTAKHLILSLSETVCARLRKKDMMAGVVSLEIVDINFKKNSAQKKLKRRSNTVNAIYSTACEIFLDIWDGKPIRHIGVGTSKVESKEEDQLNFFEYTFSKEEKLYKAVDDIRDKYGDDSLKRASFLESEFRHMEGNKSKKKKDGIVYL
ncbi:Y-family DNA polymerase [Peptostreptococcus faecalis]|uniref:Y-family DNA polymerase n=1 Tax=Peptostreptococcus faecalis TaxID=2045015 RepID=UPI000C7BD8F8|nr:DNA polymerase IV [Peptostreptococcus faecalis]